MAEEGISTASTILVEGIRFMEESRSDHALDIRTGTLEFLSAEEMKDSR